MIRVTDDSGNTWYEPNWRECEGDWKRVDTDGDGEYNEDDVDDDGDGVLDVDDTDWYNTWEFTASTWKEDLFPRSRDLAIAKGEIVGDNEDPNSLRSLLKGTNVSFGDASTINIDHYFEVYEGMFGGGIAVLDYNNDGFEDLYIIEGLILLEITKTRMMMETYF